MKDLAGRTAFVTGGANGIGLGLARVLLDQGCKVVIADIREDSIEQALVHLDNRRGDRDPARRRLARRLRRGGRRGRGADGAGHACSSTMPA